MEDKKEEEPKRGRLGIDNPTPIQDAFQQMSKDLDERHDRRERLVKLSRDVTNDSKKTIFLLHRVSIPGTSKEDVLKRGRESLRGVHATLAKIADEVAGEEFHKHLKSFKWGLQEYVEAVSFLAYLENGSLITLEDVMEQMKREWTSKEFFITDVDFLLGLADLSGELMRLCVNCVTNGDRKTPVTITAFMKEMLCAFEALPPCVPGEMNKKISIMRESLRKCERVCYNITIRGSEYADVPSILLEDPSSGEPTE